MLKALLCLLLAAPAAAASFPLGFYGVSGPADLEPLKKAGFNSFHTYAQEPAALAALAAEASRLGLRMVAHPDKVIGSTWAAAAAGWPVLAWYLYDEPEVRRLPAADLQALDFRVKAWNPEARTTFVMGKGMAAYTYAAAAGDALMLDWYPVDHLKLESLGYQLALARQAAPAKPLWAVLQAFDWKVYPQLVSPRVGRFPSWEEVRFMTYLSVARGARGVFYFTLRDGTNPPLPEQPLRWAIFEKLAGELNRLMPALESAREKPAPAGLDRKLSATVLAGGGKTFLILLNPTPEMVPLDTKKLKGWRPLFEVKRDLGALLPGDKAKWLPPYRVLVFQKRGLFN